MYKELTKSMFIDEFKKWDTYKDNFSYEGLSALYDYFENMEEETGEKIELDVVAICCEFSEYDSLDDLKAEYDSVEDLDDLKDKTQVIELENGGLIIQEF